MDGHRGDSGVPGWTTSSHVDRWPLAGVILGLTLAWVMLGWPWLSGRVTIPWDAKAHFQPQISFLAQSLARGDSPFWAPYVFSGHPQIADPQSLIFSPFLLLAALSPAPSLRLMDGALLALVLAGAAALVVWFRDRGWHSGGAVLAGIAFAFGAAMAWRIQHVGQVTSMALVPITLVLLERALARHSYAYGIAAGLAAAVLVLGRDQIALLGVYLLASFVAWHWLSGRDVVGNVRNEAGPLLAGGLAGLALVLVPVLLTALVAGQSNRPAIDFAGAGAGSLHPAQLMTLISPDIFGASGHMADYWGPPSMVWQGTGLYTAQNVGQLYIGAVPLLLIMAGIATGVLWTREIRFFTIATIVTIVYALGWYTPLFRLMHWVLPGVSLYRRPADAVFVIGLLTAILAGYSLHRLLTDSMPNLRAAQRLGVLVVLGATAVLAIMLAIWFGQLGKAIAPLVVTILFFAVSAFALWLVAGLGIGMPLAATVLLAGITVFDLAWHNGPSTSSAMPAAHYDVLEPRSTNETITVLKDLAGKGRSDTRRDRVELVGLGFHWPNASLTHGLESTLGYNPLRLGDYSRATGAEDHVGLPDQKKFSALMPSYRSRLADLLGLRYVATPTGTPLEKIDPVGAKSLKLVRATSDGLIYENTSALPRVMFPTHAEAADFEQMIRTGRWPEVDPLKTILLDGKAGLLANPPGSVSRERRAGTVRIVDYRNTAVAIEADSPDGGWVALNDIWHPWWRVTVGGQPAELLRANVLFRAVRVPPGRHLVEFRFRPFVGAWDQLWSRSRQRTDTGS